MGQFSHLADVDGLNVIALPITRSDPANVNKDGMQEAHLTGANLYDRSLEPLRTEIDPFGIGTSEMPSNGVLAPETQAGSLALRVTTHSGEQLKAFDDLSFEVDNPDGDQFLSGLRQDVRDQVADLRDQRNRPA